MKEFNFKKNIFYLVVICLIFILDRISKFYVIDYFENVDESEIILTNFLSIILVWNDGIAFGLLSFESSNIYNFITLIIVLINLIILFLIFKYTDIRSFFLAIILGGSLGNLFDRFYFSGVPDFIDLNYNNFHWFIFNVADIFITIGVICLIFVEIILNKKLLKKN